MMRATRMKKIATAWTATVGLLAFQAALGQSPESEGGGSGGGSSSSTLLTPPAEKYAISPGGVDMRTGRYAYNRTDLSIGNGSGSITFNRMLSTALSAHIDPFATFSHNWDITLVEKKIDIQRGKFRHGPTNPDYRLTVNYGGRSDTFQIEDTIDLLMRSSTGPLAHLSSNIHRSSPYAVWTYEMSGGTKIVFRPIGGGDCSSYVRCAYASQVINADGTVFDLNYETPGGTNTTRLRSVVSNRGYALLLEYSGSGSQSNLVTKACVINMAYQVKPYNDVCPTTADATTSYGYTDFDGLPRLTTVTNALGQTETYSYSADPNPPAAQDYARQPGPYFSSYRLSFYKPAAVSPWQVLSVVVLGNLDQEFDHIVHKQDFSDGSKYEYMFGMTPANDDTMQTVVGGSYTDALSHTTQVNFGQHRNPPLQPPPAVPESSDTVVQWQITPGPESIVDPLGRMTSMDYCDPNAAAGLPPNVSDRCLVNFLVKVTDPEGAISVPTYEYGHLKHTRQKAKPNSSLSDISVAGAGNGCLPGGGMACMGKWATITDANGNVTDYTYDPVHGGILTETRPAPTTGANRPQKRYHYSQYYAWYKDAFGTLIQSSSPVWLLDSTSECRTNSYPACENTADETRTTYVYGTPGTPNNLELTSITIAAGDGSLTATTVREHDKTGNVTTLDGPLPGSADTTKTRYDFLRRTIGTISSDPDDSGPLLHRAVRNTYSADGDLVKVERGTVLSQSDADWVNFASLQAVDTVYDQMGRKTQESASGSGVTKTLTHYKYDLAGRLECTAVRMDPSQWNLQTDACVPQLSGPFGPDRISKNVYNAAGERVQLIVGLGTDVESVEESYTYTSNGKLETITDGEGNKTYYTYDGHDRLDTTYFPHKTVKGAWSTTDYERNVSYDLNGNVLEKRLRDGNSIGFGYDALNRIATKDLPTSEHDVTMTYDLLGHPRVTTQNGVTVELTWDALGRNKSEIIQQGTMSYDYDEAGRRKTTTWPDNFYVTQEYLTTGEVKAIRENGATAGVGVLATYAFDNLGRRTGITRGNGTSSTFAFDNVSRLASLSHDLSATANDVASTFGYNPSSQIIRFTRDNKDYAWNGHYSINRGYAINGLNQVTAAGSTAIGYDDRGNLTSNGSVSYTYTLENRLITGNGSSFSYDPIGRLWQSAGPNDTVRFQYDGTDLVAEYNTSNLLVRRYVHGPGADEPLVWYEGSGTSDRRWHHQDERGSVVALSNSSGQRIAINTYDEYGIPGANNQGRFQYTGQTWMGEIGMYYYKARIYSPHLGRFLQTDPIGHKDGINLYAYVGNDPTNATDPDGKIANFIGKFVVDVVVEVAIQAATGQEINLGSAVKESAKGILNPAKTAQRIAKLGKALSRANDARIAARAAKMEKHHIVPKADARAADARDNMRAHGIDPKTEKSNLVDIPGDKHDITKRDSYVRDTNDRIASQPDADSIKSECCKIGEGLKNSTLEELDRKYQRK